MSTGVDQEALRASLRRLEQRHDSAMLEGALRELVDACNGLFRLQGCGVMLVDEHGQLRYTVATDATSQLLEDAQLDTGQGPCVDTYVRAETVACSDVLADARWPELGARMAGQSIRAVMGVPIRLSGIVVGSLDACRDRPHEWEEAERHALSRFASVAGVMLTAAVQADRSGVLVDQLTFAIRHRAPIERGVGYLMARDGIGQVEAFNVLRNAARSSRRAMGEVATELLSSGLLPGERR